MPISAWADGQHARRPSRVHAAEEECVSQFNAHYRLQDDESERQVCQPPPATASSRIPTSSQSRHSAAQSGPQAVVSVALASAGLAVLMVGTQTVWLEAEGLGAWPCRLPDAGRSAELHAVGGQQPLERHLSRVSAEVPPGRWPMLSSDYPRGGASLLQHSRGHCRGGGR